MAQTSGGAAQSGDKNHFYRHGKCGTKIYRLWKGMVNRCHQPSDFNYKYYGARGIAVCARWRDFKNFYSDMGERPKGKMLDRRNNNGNYSPDNCEWVTAKQSGNNRRSNRLLTLNGETKTLTQWAEFLGISHKTLRARLGVYRWSEERTLTTPAYNGTNQNGFPRAYRHG